MTYLGNIILRHCRRIGKWVLRKEHERENKRNEWDGDSSDDEDE